MSWVRCRLWQTGFDAGLMQNSFIFFGWENLLLQSPLCPHQTESPDRLEVTGFKCLLWLAGYDSGCVERFFSFSDEKKIFASISSLSVRNGQSRNTWGCWVLMPALDKNLSKRMNSSSELVSIECVWIQMTGSTGRGFNTQDLLTI